MISNETHADQIHIEFETFYSLKALRGFYYIIMGCIGENFIL